MRVAYQGRSCFVGALVLGDSVLLGAVPMEDMDLIVHPARQRLEPDPRSPKSPHALVKGPRVQAAEHRRRRGHGRRDRSSASAARASLAGRS
ncbi:MAG: hypothetical protein ACK5N0_01145 [Synechococcaceae cyanobacterium]